MGKSKIFDVMSFLQSYSQSLSRKPIVNSEFYDVLTFSLVTRVCAECALLQHLATAWLAIRIPFQSTLMLLLNAL